MTRHHSHYWPRAPLGPEFATPTTIEQRQEFIIGCSRSSVGARSVSASPLSLPRVQISVILVLFLVSGGRLKGERHQRGLSSPQRPTPPVVLISRAPQLPANYRCE